MMDEKLGKAIEKAKYYFTNALTFVRWIEENAAERAGKCIWTKYHRYGYETANPFAVYWQSGDKNPVPKLFKTPPLNLNDVYKNVLVGDKCIKSGYYRDGIIDSSHYVHYSNEEVVEFIVHSDNPGRMISTILYSFDGSKPSSVVAWRPGNHTMVWFSYEEGSLKSVETFVGDKAGNMIGQLHIALVYGADGSVRSVCTPVLGYGAKKQ